MHDVVGSPFFTIERLVKTELPPLPASVTKISSMLADMNVSQSSVADAISNDPVLSSRILRMANSPLYPSYGEVTNLTNAVSTIGNAAIQEAIMMSGVSDSFGRKILSSANGKKIWMHLLGTAMTATEICRTAKMRGLDEAFSCGLLHDIGKLILLRADAPMYGRLLEDSPSEDALRLTEKVTFGFDHAELGAEAAISWNLPAAVCHMIRYHHEPEKATAGVALAHMITVADMLVNTKLDGESLELFMLDERVQKFNLDLDKFEQIWEKVEPKLTEAMETFA